MQEDFLLERSASHTAEISRLVRLVKWVVPERKKPPGSSVAARDNMLMRYAKVAADGRYTPPPTENAKASYSTMVYVRSTIVEDAGWHLAKAATIAVSHQLGVCLRSPLSQQ